MSPELVFSFANGVALLSWLLLGFAILAKRDFLRDRIAGYGVPLVLAALYSMLIVFFFAKAEGGFDTLANVQRLFTSPWAALAGWVHYLCFDLLIGSWIAKRVREDGLPKLSLILLLPLTFMFGPIGYLGFEIIKFLFTSENKTS